MAREEAMRSRADKQANLTAARRAEKLLRQRTNVYVEIARACQFSLSDTESCRTSVSRPTCRAWAVELGPVDPPKSRPKAGTDLWSRPLYAYKPRQRRVGQPGAGARRRGAKTRHKGGPPRAHTTEAYLKTPLPA